MSSLRQFLADNKAWWIVPILIVLLAVAWVVWLDTHGADDAGDEPFTYEMY